MSADQAAWIDLADLSSGAGAQMYAENRGAASDVECPPEITMPTGSLSVISVLCFMVVCGVRCVPGTVGDARHQAPPMPGGPRYVTRLELWT